MVFVTTLRLSRALHKPFWQRLLIVSIFVDKEGPTVQTRASSEQLSKKSAFRKSTKLHVQQNIEAMKFLDNTVSGWPFVSAWGREAGRD